MITKEDCREFSVFRCFGCAKTVHFDRETTVSIQQRKSAAQTPGPDYYKTIIFHEECYNAIAGESFEFEDNKIC